jgi:hypothetical protein
VLLQPPGRALCGRNINIYVRVDHAVLFDRFLKVQFVPTHSPADSKTVVRPNETASRKLQFSVYVTL